MATTTSLKPTTFPGFSTPGVGFEQPFEMLEACHDRVRRSLSLLERLIDHVRRHGHDAVSRSAAQDVLRYFDKAAPLHHDDEEKQVFPKLLAADENMSGVILALRRDHQDMIVLWDELRQPLIAWAAATPPAPTPWPDPATVQKFLDLYATHLQREETLVFPATKALMSEIELVRMGAAMQARRAGPRSA